jgi:hypothetical protein
MTSTPFTSGATDAEEHPDVVDISALMEGVIAPDREAKLRAHLLSCELCADVRRSLEDIRDTLGTLPGPVRMPNDIAGRIDAALAAEALLSASSVEGPRGHVSRETSPSAVTFAERDVRTPDAPDAPHASGNGPEEAGEPGDPREGRAGRAHSHPRSALRLARASSPLRSSATVSRETGATRPPSRGNGPAGPGRGRPFRPARRWRNSLLAAAGAVAVFGLGGLVISSLGPSESGLSHSGLSHSGASHSGASPGGISTTADAALKHHVQHLLAGTKKPTGASAPEVTPQRSPDNGNSPMAGGASTVPSCVRRGIDRTDTPLAIDERSPYKGGSGYLVVLPHRGGAQRVDAYVLDASCVGQGNASPATVLLKRTYPRH